MEEKQDSWFWIGDDKGVFTVRSYYRWLTGEFASIHASFWNRLWSLKVPGKIVNFLWRMCRGYFPTTNALAMKRVDISINCPWYHNGVETDGHVIFGCDFAKNVWKNSEVKHLVHYDLLESTFEVLSRYFVACSINQCVLIGMICRSIWNRRNKWVWERVNGSVFAGKHRSKHADGWYKGSLVAARCSQVEGSWSPREAEAISLKEALSWVKELELKCCVFEIDSKVLVLACNGQGGESYFHIITFDCIKLLKHFDHVLVEFVYWSANRVVHELAKAAHSMPGLGEWLVTPPDFINHELDKDMS
ncbi:uncharacterized protein LOC141718921 [Apium graveolens]|uniref:uncharacterized protein LOC141718921 n=1 Tax=Apium graveolens TaxID=4045 RepID=UPI003D7ACE65